MKLGTTAKQHLDEHLLRAFPLKKHSSQWSVVRDHTNRPGLSSVLMEMKKSPFLELVSWIASTYPEKTAAGRGQATLCCSLWRSLESWQQELRMQHGSYVTSTLLWWTGTALLHLQMESSKNRVPELLLSQVNQIKYNYHRHKCMAWLLKHLKSKQNSRFWKSRRAPAQQCALRKRMGKRQENCQKALLGRLSSA